MRGIFEIVRARHSCRVPFDPKRCVSEQDLLQILEAARGARRNLGVTYGPSVSFSDHIATSVIGVPHARRTY